MKLINPNHIKDDNFEFFRKDRDSVIYIENGKTLRIQAEAGYDPDYFTALYLSPVEKWNIPGNTPINAQKKLEIEENLIKGFQLMRTRLKIE